MNQKGTLSGWLQHASPVAPSASSCPFCTNDLGCHHHHTATCTPFSDHLLILVNLLAWPSFPPPCADAAVPNRRPQLPTSHSVEPWYRASQCLIRCDPGALIPGRAALICGAGPTAGLASPPVNTIHRQHLHTAIVEGGAANHHGQPLPYPPLLVSCHPAAHHSPPLHPAQSGPVPPLETTPIVVDRVWSLRICTPICLALYSCDR